MQLCRHVAADRQTHRHTHNTFRIVYDSTRNVKIHWHCHPFAVELAFVCSTIDYSNKWDNESEWKKKLLGEMYSLCTVYLYITKLNHLASGQSWSINFDFCCVTEATTGRNLKSKGWQGTLRIWNFDLGWQLGWQRPGHEGRWEASLPLRWRRPCMSMSRICAIALCLQLMTQRDRIHKCSSKIYSRVCSLCEVKLCWYYVLSSVQH